MGGGPSSPPHSFSLFFFWEKQRGEKREGAKEREGGEREGYGKRRRARERHRSDWQQAEEDRGS